MESDHQRGHDRVGRRVFLGAVSTGLGVAALGACSGGLDGDGADGSAAPRDGGRGSDGGGPLADGGGSTTERDGASAGDGAVGNRAPVWRTVPTISFLEGTAASISIAAYVSDADGDALAITLNDMPLPPGVTFDAATMQFVYDGVGGLGETDGHVLTADDGRG